MFSINDKTLKDFINIFECDFSKNVPNEEIIKKAQEILGISFGSQLYRYLLEYGYLGFLSIEFYGINALSKEKSDMISQAQYLHKEFPAIQKYIPLENVSDSLYILIDSEDNIFLFDIINNKITEYNIKLFEYIKNRFVNELISDNDFLIKLIKSTIKQIEGKLLVEENSKMLKLILVEYVNALNEFENLGEIKTNLIGLGRMYLESYSDYMNNDLLNTMYKVELILREKKRGVS